MSYVVVAGNRISYNTFCFLNKLQLHVYVYVCLYTLTVLEVRTRAICQYVISITTPKKAPLT